MMMNRQYPNSTGEIYCLEKEQYELYLEAFSKGA